ncbi:MAG: hypothetical protein A2452_07515 [Candidatus Firestonebacteria bacterium RIFOXYC2_FULL_39_67]|nr:MAG: hypothetical protein A2536_01590 [Candidatus Firestonebacteria bacterium RIFOXYD2_FULL_39_29]OGF52953.1 MAG: hypothetical protein A2497_00100 [Candidatus Firestonebacteria bacterium RifOxyC12_full_39_7]OGF55505.1 MAG: hypothetical protein A2452_07515 [Candidatus Firestonebacteria bacterium RIFOXYC2_FULL_39_67]
MEMMLYGILVISLMMTVVKRFSALVTAFALQSFLLFLLILIEALKSGSIQLYIVAGLILVMKVIAIPAFLGRIVKKIKTSEELGLFVNTALSILIAVALVGIAYYFIGNFLPAMEKEAKTALVIALSVTLIGVFIMIFRMKALAQVVGLLIMENGIFLAGASITDGVPFFVEIAVSFDVFVAVIILGVFVYRINSLFTHIDADKLNELKG